MNLLNFFNTFSGCTGGVGGEAMDCRGAENAAEFERQWPKTVAAILGTGADVVGVLEIENDGYGSGSSLAFLVQKLDAASAPGTWTYIDADAGTGEVNSLGTDAIKVGLIYKRARVVPLGQTAALNTVAFVNGGDSGPRNRPSLAQAFEQFTTGARFVISVNHLKSKGSACDLPDSGDGQGECNAVRTIAANLLTAWLASDSTGTGDPDVLIVGDLNAYGKRIRANDCRCVLHQLGAGVRRRLLLRVRWTARSIALANASLRSQVTSARDWFINADEPTVLDYNTNFKSPGQVLSLYAPDRFRMSDHNPLAVDLDLISPSTPRRQSTARELVLGASGGAGGWRSRIHRQLRGQRQVQEERRPRRPRHADLPPDRVGRRAPYLPGQGHHHFDVPAERGHRRGAPDRDRHHHRYHGTRKPDRGAHRRVTAGHAGR